MAMYVLIHGAGDVGWYWHLVAAELRERGHEAVAPDLPCEDDSAGLSEYADAVLDAIGDRSELVVVAQSFAGFTAPLVCDRTSVELLVLVAGMIPSPGEAPRDWWANTGYEPEDGEWRGDEVAAGCGGVGAAAWPPRGLSAGGGSFISALASRLWLILCFALCCCLLG